MNEDNKNPLIAIVLFAVAIAVFYFLLVDGIIPAQKAQIDGFMCCGDNQTGTPSCTDTYYNAEDNLCHLTKCEGMLGLDRGLYGNCTYPPVNKTTLVLY